MLVLLGPQRFRPTLGETMRSLGLGGPVAVITAGWRERESEDQELQEHLGSEVVDLQLYRRSDDVLRRDPELAAALRGRQEHLKELQRLYRRRLAHALDAARELLALPGRSRLLHDQRRAAIRSVRTLDRRHVRRIGQALDAFDRRWRPSERPAVAGHCRELAAIVQRSAALCVAGGHVAVLANRMRLFDLPAMIGQRPVIAWSAGAMALAERVVLFHDSPPQGPGNAEVFDRGLGLAPGVLPLPHGRQRLQLDDRQRVALFARRFGPDLCTILDEGSRLDWDGRRWTASPGTQQLGSRGQLREMATA